MADDAAAPEGELTETAAEPESEAIEDRRTGLPMSDDRGPRRQTYDDERRREDDEAARRAAAEADDVARAAGDDRRAGRGAGTGRADRLAGLPGLRVASGRAAARAVPAGGQAGCDEPDHHRLRNTPTPTCSASWTRRPDTFYDDFHKRAQPFVDVVKQAQSKSVGTVTEAGVESEDGRRGPGAGRGDRQDLQCRCARAGSRAPGGCGSRCRRSVTRPRSPTWSSCRDVDRRPDSQTDDWRKPAAVPIDDAEQTDEQVDEPTDGRRRNRRPPRRRRNRRRGGRRRAEPRARPRAPGQLVARCWPLACCRSWRCYWRRPRAS